MRIRRCTRDKIDRSGAWIEDAVNDQGVAPMTSPLFKLKPISLADFNELLASAPEDARWELINGRVIRGMIGARWEHARIVSNLHIGLGRRLRDKGSPCRVFAESFRLQRDHEETSFLPDIIVACTPLASGATFLKTPTVLMEVLSDDTSALDRGEKWAAYQTIESLQHYVLVARDAVRVELFQRTLDGCHVRTLDCLDQALELPAIDVAIPLAEIYADLFG